MGSADCGSAGGSTTKPCLVEEFGLLGCCTLAMCFEVVAMVSDQALERYFDRVGSSMVGS